MKTLIMEGCPEKKVEPTPPRYWLWAGLSLCVSALVCLAVIAVSSTPWYSVPLLSCLFVALSVVIFSVRIMLFEREKVFIAAWNAERQKHIEERISWQGMFLQLRQLVIYTLAGTKGNSALAWREEPLVIDKTALPSLSNPVDEIFCVIERVLNEQFLNVLDKLSFVDVFFTGFNNENNKEAFVQAWSVFTRKYHLDYNVTFTNTNEITSLFNQWVDNSQEGGAILVLAVDIFVRNPSAASFLFIKETQRDNQNADNLKIQRPFVYKNKNSLSEAAICSGVALSDIEAVWCNGISESLRTEILLNLQVDAPEVSPDFINVDSALGYSVDMANWITLALAAEHAGNSRKAQLAVSLHDDVVMQIVSFDEKSAR